MFGTIRKHQTWLWAVIITLTVISFVVYFSPYSKMNNSGGRSGNHGSINGDKVSDQQYRNAFHEVDLNGFVMSRGHWLTDDKKRTDQDLDREIYQWLLLVWEQEKLGIHVSDQSAAEMARGMIGAFSQAGITSSQMFIERVLQPHGLTIDDFERYVRHFVGIQELINTVGLPGRLVTPQEAKGLYERDHQETAGQAVFFSASNYLAGISITPEMLSQFYSNRVANYGIPERVVVSYVRFNVTNYLPRAESELSTNLSEIVEGNFQRLGTNAATVFPEAKTPAEVKAKIRQEIVHRQALTMANQKATEFARALFDLQPARAENLQTLARTNGLEIGVTAPFDRDQEPAGLKVQSDFNKAAFALSTDDPFGGPVVGQDGVYILAFQKQMPFEIPTLDQIHDKVESDYKRMQAMIMAQQATRTFYQAVTNGMNQGKTFDAVCADQKVKPLEVPPFSLTTQRLPVIEDMIRLDQLKQAALLTQPGKASPPQPTAEGGMILYVKAKLPLDPAKMQADLPKFAASVRRARQQEAFDAWFRHEAEKGLRDTPLARPSPSQLGAANNS